MISVIIAAAGSGTRMGGSVKKQYRKVENLTVLEKTVKAFCAFGGSDSGNGSFRQLEIVVAGPADDLDYIHSLLDPLGGQPGAPVIKIVAGGETRTQSVSNALKASSGDFILVHDAARCFIDQETITRVVRALLGTGEGQERDRRGTGEGLSPSEPSAPSVVIPCVRPKSTIRTADETLNRAELFEVQTPQGFTRSALTKAFEAALKDGITGTDEASLTDRIGIKPVIVEGSYTNIKITTEDDMPKDIRVGTGYDVHKLAFGRKLMLGCVEIPYENGLLGHSDADVLSHAIADALLGACALRDIGYYFPDSSAETEGMPGRVLLSKVQSLVTDAGFTIVNVDATVVAQKPKLAPYIEQMRIAVADALKLGPDQVGIKATTEEGLGITGTGDAMTAQATASVK